MRKESPNEEEGFGHVAGVQQHLEGERTHERKRGFVPICTNRSY
jgi:hypothetical protein